MGVSESETLAADQLKWTISSRRSAFANRSIVSPTVKSEKRVGLVVAEGGSFLTGGSGIEVALLIRPFQIGQKASGSLVPTRLQAKRFC